MSKLKQNGTKAGFPLQLLLFMKQKSILTGILFITALLIVLFFRFGGSWLVIETPPQQADAIVMLLGSSPERELEVANLYHKNLAQKILFVNFSTHNTRLLDSLSINKPHGADINLIILQHIGVPYNSITVLEGEISSTRGEAVAVRKYLETHDHIKSIILVSSPPHMRRVRLTFRKELRKLDHSVELVLRPSSYSDFQSRRWYRHRDSARSVLLEYLKLAGWVVGI